MPIKCGIVRRGWNHCRQRDCGCRNSWPIAVFSNRHGRNATPHADGNVGASSLYRANPSYPHERYVQKEITVEAISLGLYAESHSPPDLLWMDLQGAELRALRGAGDLLRRVKVIQVETSLRPVYVGQPLFWDVDEFLAPDFELVVLRLGRWPKILPLYRAFGIGPWFGDAIYVRRDLLTA